MIPGTWIYVPCRLPGAGDGLKNRLTCVTYDGPSDHFTFGIPKEGFFGHGFVGCGDVLAFRFNFSLFSEGSLPNLFEQPWEARILSPLPRTSHMIKPVVTPSTPSCSADEDVSRDEQDMILFD